MEFKFLSVGCGDCIHIRFMGDDGKTHHILVDGGVEGGNIYPETLRAEIRTIIEQEEIIDLWIITHIDDDHIGGILRFIRDDSLLSQVNLSSTCFWFNSAPFDYDTGIKESNLKSTRQGIRLRDFLASRSSLQEDITDEYTPNIFFGLQMIILSPSRANLGKLYDKWGRNEVKIRKGEVSARKVSGRDDYGKKIAEFDLKDMTEDASEENGSSIVILIEYNKHKFLLTADSHPSVISAALKKLGYAPEEGKRLGLTFMQVAHHGSKFNTNDELLQLVSCQDFVFSGDAINKHNLPNKETIARILKNITDRPVRFYLTHKNDKTTSIFRVDGDLPGVELRFPESGSNYLTFRI